MAGRAPPREGQAGMPGSQAIRIFVNNVDGYLAGAICADLWKLSHNIIGTRKGASDELVPPVVKLVIDRIEVRKLLKTIAECDVVVYDLHDADLEELELVLQVFYKSEFSQETVFILISSVGVWARTQREYEQVEEVREAGNDRSEEEGSAQAEVLVGAAGGAAAEGEAGAARGTAAPRSPRPAPLKSEDYIKRVPSPKFQEWKTIETLTLALQERGLRPYVVCAGLPYGNGEDPFLGLFRAAWQTKPTLRVVGKGHNHVPLVHVRDVARLVRHLVLERPKLDYHLAVDRGDITQRAFIEAVAKEFGVPYEIKSISPAEALLAEMADVLTMDLRLVPSELMPVTVPEPAVQQEPHPGTAGSGRSVAPGASPAAPTTAAPAPASTAATAAGAAGAVGTAAGAAAAAAVAAAAAAAAIATAAAEATAAAQAAAEGAGEAAAPGPPVFRWWCEAGLVANIGKVAAEFRRWRRLEPVRFCIVGPPGSGTAELGALLAERYNLPHIAFEALIEQQRYMETHIGQMLRDKFAEIETAMANPKSQGPFLLPATMAVKVVREALDVKSVEYRGFVLSGFPQSLEEATDLFFEEVPPPVPDPHEPAPPPAPPAGKAGKPSKKQEDPSRPGVQAAPQPERKALRLGLILDAAALLTCPEEGCLARMHAGGKPEEQWLPQYKKRMEQWKKENPESGAAGLAEFFRAKLGKEPLVAAELAPTPAAAEHAEGAAGAVRPSAELRAAARELARRVEAVREVWNFLPPYVEETASVPQEVAQEVAPAVDLAAEEALRRKREQDERIEQLRCVELARLEKESEHMRRYLTTFVVPALTAGLVEVCREQPADPAGYLAEYLAVYSELSRRRLEPQASASSAG